MGESEQWIEALGNSDNRKHMVLYLKQSLDHTQRKYLQQYMKNEPSDIAQFRFFFFLKKAYLKTTYS